LILKAENAVHLWRALHVTLLRAEYGQTLAKGFDY